MVGGVSPDVSVRLLPGNILGIEHFCGIAGLSRRSPRPPGREDVCSL